MTFSKIRLFFSMPILHFSIFVQYVQSGASYLSQGFEDNILGSSSG